MLRKEFSANIIQCCRRCDHCGSKYELETDQLSIFICKYCSRSYDLCKEHDPNLPCPLCNNHVPLHDEWSNPSNPESAVDTMEDLIVDNSDTIETDNAFSYPNRPCGNKE